MKKILTIIIALLIIISAGLSAYAITGTTSEQKDTLSEKSNEAVSTTDAIQETKQIEEIDTQSTPVPTSFSSVKEEIVYKMLNSMDYFTTAQVSFSALFPGFDIEEYYTIETNLNTGISHQTKSDNFSQSYASAANAVNAATSDVNEAYESYSDGVTVRSYNNLEKTVQTIGTSEERRSLDEEWPDLEERYYIDENGDPNYCYRGNPTNASMAGECLLPQVSAFAYLMDEDLWEVTESLQYCGRDCYSVEGTVNDSYSAQIGAETFMMYVDKETGILLKLEACDANGDVVSSMVVSEISIDAPQTRSAFVYDMSKYEGYTELPSRIGPQS